MPTLKKPSSSKTPRKTTQSKKLKPARTEITHPWRPCPLGQYPVREHERKVSISVKNPDGSATVRFQCRHYRSHKDHLYPLDIKEVANENFHKIKKTPRKVDWKSKEWAFKNQNEFDSLIGGWTEY